MEIIRVTYALDASTMVIRATGVNTEEERLKIEGLAKAKAKAKGFDLVCENKGSGRLDMFPRFRDYHTSEAAEKRLKPIVEHVRKEFREQQSSQ